MDAILVEDGDNLLKQIVMAYATPLCSALLLAASGIESLTWKLLGGAILIALAGIVSRADLK